MKKFTFLLLSLLFILSSCYIYKPYQFKEVEASVSTRPGGPVSLRSDAKSEKQVPNSKEDAERKKRAEEAQKKEQMKSEQKAKTDLSSPDLPESGIKVEEEKEKRTGSFSTKESPDKNIVTEKKVPQVEISSEDSLKIKIQPTKYYKIAVEGKQYKIQADQWEGDTLVSHILRKPEKVLRFHKNQIDEENLLERRFSKPFSDMITIGAYVVGGAAVLLLVL